MRRSDLIEWVDKYWTPSNPFSAHLVWSETPVAMTIVMTPKEIRANVAGIACDSSVINKTWEHIRVDHVSCASSAGLFQRTWRND